MKAIKINRMQQRSEIKHIDISKMDVELLLENMDDGVCLVNEHGYISYVNTVYEEIFRTNKGDILGKNIFMMNIDEVIMESFRKKKNIKSKLNYFIGDSQIKVSTTTIFNRNKFNGVLGVYSKFKNQEIDNMIKLNNNSYEDNNKFEYILDKPFQKIIGKSQAIRKALYRAQKASYTNSTVLIRGESGTGKELVAKAIHENSKRSDKPFITLNCGAIPSNLIQSELFGHEKGAFTGAFKKKIGKFELANGGTIFLDEIGDLPYELQVELLRVLQEKEFTRIGGNETIKVDVRIISATHKDLEEMIEKGEFREDLYYRLNVIPIYLPTLRERKDDINLLIDHFISKISCEKFQITDEAKDCLYNYNWPGNVRELENVIERIIVLSENDIININDLPYNISKMYGMNLYKSDEESLINMKKDGKLATLEDYEKEIIKEALKRFGSFNAAGKALGITHKTVAYKARKYGLVE